MTHEQNNQLHDDDVIDFLYQGLDAEDSSRVESHIARNAHLDAEIRDARRLLQAFSSSKLESAPVDLIERVVHQAETHIKLGSIKAGWLGRFWFHAWFRQLTWVTAILLVAVSAGGLFGKRDVSDFASQQRTTISDQGAASIGTGVIVSDRAILANESSEYEQIKSMIAQNRLRDADINLLQLAADSRHANNPQLYILWIDVQTRLGHDERVKELQKRLEQLQQAK